MKTKEYRRLLRTYGPVLGFENVMFHLAALNHVMGPLLTMTVAAAHLDALSRFGEPEMRT